MGCTQRELQQPCSWIRSRTQFICVFERKNRPSLNGQNLWAAGRHVHGVLKLGDVAAVSTPQDVVSFQKADADEFLDQGVPLALQARLVSLREGFLQHGEGPSLSKRKGGVPF